jgi:hypothetical protein
MQKVELSKQQIEEILEDTRARRKHFIEKANKLSAAGKHKESFGYCKVVSDLSGQIVRFHEMYIELGYAA